jgi:hypothetical protein
MHTGNYVAMQWLEWMPTFEMPCMCPLTARHRVISERTVKKAMRKNG